MSNADCKALTLITALYHDRIEPNWPLENVQAALQAIGYGIEITGQADDLTRAVLTAFQRHFLPGNLTGIADEATIGRLMDFAAIV